MFSSPEDLFVEKPQYFEVIMTTPGGLEGLSARHSLNKATLEFYEVNKMPSDERLQVLPYTMFRDELKYDSVLPMHLVKKLRTFRLLFAD